MKNKYSHNFYHIVCVLTLVASFMLFSQSLSFTQNLGFAQNLGLTQNQAKTINKITLDAPSDVSDPAFIARLADLRQKFPIKTDDLYNLENIQTTLRSLYEIGIFSYIKAFAEFSESSVDLRFRFVPIVILESIQLAGNDEISSKDLMRTIRIRKGDSIFEEDMKTEQARMKEFYRRRGFPKAEIKVTSLKPDNPYRATVLFEITENEETKISKIKFIGDKFFKQKKIEKTFRLKPGDRLDLEKIYNEIENLKNFYKKHDFFEVKIDFLEAEKTDWQSSALYSQGLVQIKISAGRKIITRFIGNRLYSKRELMEVLLSEQDEMFSYSYSSREKLKQSLIDFYQQKGYLHVKVRIKDKLIGKRKKIATFYIHEGLRVKLKDAKFIGNKYFDEDQLQDELFAYVRDRLIGIENEGLQPPDKISMTHFVYRSEFNARKYSMWSDQAYMRPGDLDSDEVYLSAIYSDAAKAVQQFYYEHGFLSCEISEPKLVFNHTGQRLELIFDIKEGMQTYVRSIRVKGLNVKEVDEVLLLAGIEIGSPLNDYLFDAAKSSIKDSYESEGYLYSKVKTSYKLTTDHSFADIIIELDEGYQVSVGQIIVSGANKTRTQTVINELTFSEGDVYLPKDMEDSQRWLQKLGVFQAVTLNPWDPEKQEKIKSVLINTIERPPGRFEVSGGLGTDDGIRLSSLLIYRNLFGVALEFHLSGKVNYRIPVFLDTQFQRLYEKLSFFNALEREFAIGLFHPSIKGSHIGARIDLVHLRQQERSYGLDKNSLLISFSTEILRYLTLAQINEISYLFSDRTNLPDLPGQTINEDDLPPVGQTWEISPKLQGIFDYRDSIFNPTRGVVISGLLEYFETITGKFDTDLFKGTGSVSGYIPIPIMRRPVVLRLTGKIGANIRVSGNNTPADKRFKLGGRMSVRGFGEEAIYPADMTNFQRLAAQNGEFPSYGGDAFILLKADLRIPVYKSYYIGGFSDLGSLWNDPAHMDFKLNNYKKSAGAGIHYHTPVGDISLEMGWNLDRNAALGENRWRLHFSISLF